MPMYKMIEYSSNYSETTERLCLYSKDEAASFNNGIENTDNLNLSSISSMGKTFMNKQMILI